MILSHLTAVPQHILINCNEMRSLQNFVLFLFSFCPADSPKGRRIADAPLESPRPLLVFGFATRAI